MVEEFSKVKSVFLLQVAVMEREERTGPRHAGCIVSTAKESRQLGKPYPIFQGEMN